MTNTKSKQLVSAIFFSAAGLSASAAQMTVSGVPPTTGIVGEEYRFLPTVENADISKLEFNYINKPDWSKSYRGSGLILGVPTAPGVFTGIQIGAWDGAQYAVLPPFTLTISATAANQLGAGNAYISWTKPVLNDDGSPLTDLSGYLLRYGTTAQSMAQLSVAAADSSFELEGLAPGNWYFQMAAVNSSDVSGDFSALVSTPIE